MITCRSVPLPATTRRHPHLPVALKRRFVLTVRCRRWLSCNRSTASARPSASRRAVTCVRQALWRKAMEISGNSVVQRMLSASMSAWLLGGRVKQVGWADRLMQLPRCRSPGAVHRLRPGRRRRTRHRHPRPHQGWSDGHRVGPGGHRSGRPALVGRPRGATRAVLRQAPVAVRLLHLLERAADARSLRGHCAKAKGVLATPAV
jgi:hypothetical protein